MQLNSFNLYTTGVYSRCDGRKISLNSLAMHSETGEIYAILSEVQKDIFFAEKLSLFGHPNFQGEGPRHCLFREYLSCVNLVFLSYDDIKPGVYGHFKGAVHGGREYDVYGTLKSDEGDFVLYRPCYGTRPMMIRPLPMFTENVDMPEYGYKGSRFYKLRNF